MKKLMVNEIFDSYQGEGSQIGTICTFVRLQGCSVGCDFCDTKHTWSFNTKLKDSIVYIMSKSEAPYASFAEMTDHEILENCKENCVVITGGEPLEQNITDLLGLLVEKGKKVIVETSGNFEFSKVNGVFYVVSPKIGKNTDITVLSDSLKKADEVKIVPSANIVVNLEKLIRSITRESLLTFQPESCSPESLEICIALARKYSGKLSIQTHKYVGKR